jgi:hypothetical protein
VTFDEVVIGKVKANRRNEVLTLLAEGQRQASETAHMETGGSVQPLHVAGRDEVFVPVARIDEFPGGGNTRRAVTAIVDLLVSVNLDDLGIVHFRTESLSYSARTRKSR